MTDSTIWQKAVRGSRFGFATIWGSVDKNDQPTNKTANKVGAETFWPSTIDRESYKAARILRSFCKDGVYEEASQQSQDPTSHQKVIKKIPITIIRNAKGLAIFTTMRSGLWYSGAGGSGVLVSRMTDGTWSPPSGILLHTAATGLVAGVDICDCIIVLNTQEALDAFAKWRLTLGGAMTAVAGPLGTLGLADSNPYENSAPILTYLRSKGFHADAQVDGTVIVERSEENQKYYGYKYSASEIVSGKVRTPPTELRTLWQTLKAAQGDSDADHTALPTEPSPADLEVVHSDYVFGVPDKEDPDPFGVLALEKEGLQIREAGTKTAVPNEVFEFRPNPTSPIFDTYNTRTFEKDQSETRRSSWKDRQDSRRSSYMDKQDSRRSSWRNSTLTISSVDRPKHITTDIFTQLDLATPGISDPENALKMDTNSLLSTPSALPSIPAPLPQTPPQVPPKSLVPMTGPARLSPSPPQGSFHEPKGKVVNSHATTTAVAVGANVAQTDGAVLQRQGLIPGPAHEESKVQQSPHATPSLSRVDAKPVEIEHNEDENLDEDDEEDDEPVIIEQVQQAARPQVVFKPRVVTIPRHLRPNVPQRNPSRIQRTGSIQSLPSDDDQSTDQTSMTSIRSSLAPQDGHQDNNSVMSSENVQLRQASPSSQSVPLEDKADDSGSPAHNSSSSPNASATLPQQPPNKPEDAPTAAGTSEVISGSVSNNTTKPLLQKNLSTSANAKRSAPSSSPALSKGSATTTHTAPGKKSSPTANGLTTPTPAQKATTTVSGNSATSTSAKKIPTAANSNNNTGAPLSPGKFPAPTTAEPTTTEASALLSSTKKPASVTASLQGPAPLVMKGKTGATVNNSSNISSQPVQRKSTASKPVDAALTSPPMKAPAATDFKPAMTTAQVQDPAFATAHTAPVASPVMKLSATSNPTLPPAQGAKSSPVANHVASLSPKQADLASTHIPTPATSLATASAPIPATTTTFTAAPASTFTTSPALPSTLASTSTVATIPAPALNDTDIELPLPSSPSDNKTAAPRISLMSMKFSLDDDDKSDNDDDEPPSPPPPRSPERNRVQSMGYRYNGEDDFS